MYNEINIEDINKFNLNEDELNQIVNDVAMKYVSYFNTKITHDLLKEDIQTAIDQYTIQKRRDNKINQILNDKEPTMNKRINLTINIDYNRIY